MGKNAGQVAFQELRGSQLTVRVDMGPQPNNQKALISDNNINELRASRQEVRLLTP